jgi:hypothetical protein
MTHSDDTEARRYNTKKGRGVKMKGKKDKTPVNYHKKDSQARVDALLKSMKEDFYKKKYDVKKGGYQKTNKMTKSNKRSGDSKAQYRQVHKDIAKVKNEQQIPNLPGLGGGGGGTDSIMMTAPGKSIGKRIKDVAKMATVPARFMLNIKSPEDPTSKFATDRMTPAGKVDSAIANYKRKLNMGEQQIPNLPGLGGGGGGTNSITDKAPYKSFGKKVRDVAKAATVPARFMLNIKSPKDPTTKFAAPTTAAGKVDSAIADYKRKLNMGEGSYGFLVKETSVALTYKSGSGFDANVGGTSVRNTISNVKKAGKTIKNIKDKGLVAGVKKTFNKNTPPKTSVSDKVGNAISTYIRSD